MAGLRNPVLERAAELGPVHGERARNGRNEFRKLAKPRTNSNGVIGRNLASHLPAAML